ncbi:MULTISPECIES: type II RES/Xre toxin-antitoxin system antitoxin [Mesoflavibacter]|uniref:type II RES/Xre toxin-antitoxin system antitoxin n=1 Tax=Mesoflavibacter TaxID=444051 RepID=UPI000D10E8E0|nr:MULTISPECIES: antitoxin Xre-like helix-turn-helix domain-containing protein [Mesoflavibacter]
MKAYKTENTIHSLANEPEQFYNLNSKYDKMVSVLGGSLNLGQPINNELDLIDISRKGLPKSVIVTLSGLLGISMEKMSDLIHISHRTIQRKKSDDLLNVYSTEQILEIAEVITKGIEVFNSLEVFTKWLHQDIRYLNFQKPLNYLDTSFGTKMVLDILGRIEHGVYS